MVADAYDYVIVGSGSAGSVIANRLSADPDLRILVLEAGGPDRNFWLKLPIGYFRTIYDPRFSRVFDTVPSEGTGNRNVVWPRGRIVGGSSSINGLIFIRGQHEDFDDWEEQGAEGWSFDGVLPHFRAMERYRKGESEYRGGAGELPVSNLRNDNGACAAWMQAAQEFGLPFNPDFNGASTAGVGSYDLSLSRRLRASAAVHFLRPALKRGNVTLQTRAHVSRVIVENGVAVGVEWISGTTVTTTRASREVILAAGALQSPQILQLSGIGRAESLRRHGIDVIVDSPDVGENLQDHYQMRLLARLTRKLSLNDEVRNPFGLMKMGLGWLFAGRGPLTVGAGQVGGAACTRHAVVGRPDVQFNVSPLSADKPGTPLHRYSGFTSAVWQCHPESRGSLAIQSSDPLQQPRIEPRYLSAQKDRDAMVEGVKMLREINLQAGFRDLVAEETFPGPEVQSDTQICDAIRNGGGTVFHPVGTCRMGKDNRAVVNPRLKVHGVDGLRVIDASVMPKITSANTNAASLMIGEKGASLVLEDAGQSSYSAHTGIKPGSKELA